jgi:hypothetical protein
LQEGKWDPIPPFDCLSGFSKDCSRKVAYSASEVDSVREDCISLIGCAWHEADGEVITNPYLGGTCIGQGFQCSDLASDEDGCRSQPSCQWREPLTEAPYCDYVDSYIGLENISYCGELARSLECGSVHPEVARDRCLELMGCSWQKADGTIETGPNSDRKGPMAEPEYDPCTD